MEVFSSSIGLNKLLMSGVDSQKPFLNRSI